MAGYVRLVLYTMPLQYTMLFKWKVITAWQLPLGANESAY